VEENESLISRRRLLGMGLGLGGLIIAGDRISSLADEPKLRHTPKQTAGPFYPSMKPLDKDGDLTVVSGKAGRAQGKIIHVMGRVLNAKGEPIRNAKVEIWQANTHGRYDHPGDKNSAPLDPSFQGFGIQMTDREGRYHFKTIRPGAYPAGTATRTPHIHFDVQDQREHLITQMYFEGEPLNEKDFLFNAVKSNREALVARVLPPNKEVEPDSLIVAWDIVLGA
jgi:protocatechuate 3,4-dioxygenase beta subunit